MNRLSQPTTLNVQIVLSRASPADPLAEASLFALEKKARLAQRPFSSPTHLQPDLILYKARRTTTEAVSSNAARPGLKWAQTCCLLRRATSSRSSKNVRMVSLSSPDRPLVNENNPVSTSGSVNSRPVNTQFLPVFHHHLLSL